jgi:hypothetical protein
MTETFSIIWIAVLCLTWMNASGVCDTFSTVCPVALGQHLPVNTGLAYAIVPADEEYYVAFNVRSTRARPWYDVQSRL